MTTDVSALGSTAAVDYDSENDKTDYSGDLDNTQDELNCLASKVSVRQSYC